MAQAPIRLVGSLPFTRSCWPTCRAVPAGANFSPKIVAIAFGATVVSAGVLKPPLTIPLAEITGAVGETAGTAVSENDTFGTPLAETVTVTFPAVVPSITFALTVPSFRVMAGDGLTVAAPGGLTAKFTITPGTAAPPDAATLTTSGSPNAVPTVPLC